MQPSPLALSIGSPRDRAWLTLRTALAPMAWVATYWVFTETLPTSHPLTVGALRSVPAGLLLLAFARPRLPRRGAWLRLGVLGLANIGLFSAVINLLMLAPALYMMQVYDRVLASGNEMTLLMLTLMILGLFGLMASTR